MATVSPLLRPTRTSPGLWAPAVRECPGPGISFWSRRTGGSLGDVVGRDHLLSVSTRAGVEAPHTPFAPRHGAGGTLYRRPLLTNGGLCGRPGADYGASDHEPSCTPSPILERSEPLPASVAASSRVIYRPDRCRRRGAGLQRHTATTVPTGRRLAQPPVTFRYQSATTAPGGTSPWAPSRHKAIRSCRASATMPSFRRRALPCPKRS